MGVLERQVVKAGWGNCIMAYISHGVVEAVAVAAVVAVVEQQ